MAKRKKRSKKRKTKRKKKKDLKEKKSKKFKRSKKSKRFKRSKKRNLKKKKRFKSKVSKETKDADGNTVFKVTENWAKQAYVNKSKYEKKYKTSLKNNEDFGEKKEKELIG